MAKDIGDFENFSGVVFKNKNLLQQAFTHRSYLNENPSLALEHNERLEFLGDAVLELVITDYLYKNYPQKPEGELTSFRAALVNAVMLSEIARGLGMGDYLLLSRGEAKDVGKARQYILANTFEAVVGAIFLDRGYESAKTFLANFLFPKADEVNDKRLWIDSKSFFQEKGQELAGATPVYKVLEESGPDHDKLFTVGVFLGDEMIADGVGSSKQEAEQDAARKGLVKKRWG